MNVAAVICPRSSEKNPPVKPDIVLNHRMEDKLLMAVM